MKINIPDYVKYVMKTLNQNGFEAFVVGGAVRDALLGKEPDDWDVATNAPTEAVQSSFKRHFDTGIKHGTVTVLSGKNAVEVTTYRIDGKYKDSRRPDKVVFTNSIYEDLKRRDFTINAIAYNDADGITDPFDGMRDLKNGIIKCVGIPDERFCEDALRILRAVRFGTGLGFEIDRETLESVKKNVQLLNKISAERIYSELKKILLCDGDIGILYETGIMQTILPEVKNTAKIVNNAEKDIEVRLAALFLNTPTDECKKALCRLKLDNKTKKNTLKILQLYYEKLDENAAEIRRKMSVYGKDIFEKAILLAKAHGKNTKKICEIFERVKNDPISIKSLAVTGNDLMALGIYNEEIGKTMRLLLEYVLENPENNTVEKLTALANRAKR